MAHNPQTEKMNMELESSPASTRSDDVDNMSACSDDIDMKSAASLDFDVIEPFAEFKIKIEQLLDSIGLRNFAIEEIQHDFYCNNCVYALTSLANPQEQYFLRVAMDQRVLVFDKQHEPVETDVVVLGYLKDKLPVPHIKAYSTTEDNALGKTYTIQTKIPGDPLDQYWENMDYVDKFVIVDQYLELLVKLESVKFARAGTFAVPSTLPPTSHDVLGSYDGRLLTFNGATAISPKLRNAIENRAGPHVQSLLMSLLDMWIREEAKKGEETTKNAITQRFQKLKTMLQEFNDEGYLTGQPSPVVLHHCDLEPRNIMVSKASGAWKITGIIDWDEALALPTPLSRIPPRWIWNWRLMDLDFGDGYLSEDQYHEPELSDANEALKTYFDAKVEALLPGYNEDAYGQGVWLRRIWYFAKDGASNADERNFIDELLKDWEREMEED